VIRAEHLTKRFGRRTAIEDVSLDVERGQVVGFLGPNGAGKTTTLRVLAGVFAPTAGRALIDDLDVVRAPLAARRRLGYAPERAALHLEMTVDGLLTFAAAMKDVRGRRARREAVGTALERTGLVDRAVYVSRATMEGERVETDVRRVMELTDPRYVWLTTDTGHLTLGGMDAVQIMGDYFSRIAEVHLKDTYAKYRGNTSTPTQERHRVASVYHNLGGGGVDFPAVFKLLRDRHYKGWVVLDLDGPRKGDDGFDAIGGNMDLAVDDYIAHNINYLRDVVGVRLPPLG